MHELKDGPRLYLWRRLRSVQSVASRSVQSGGVEQSGVASRRVVSVPSVASVECQASAAVPASARSRETSIASRASVASKGVRSLLVPVLARLRLVASVSRSVASSGVQSVLRRSQSRSACSCASRPAVSRETSPSSPRSVLGRALARSKRAAAQSKFERIERRLATFEPEGKVASVAFEAVASVQVASRASSRERRVVEARVGGQYLQ